MKRFTRSAIGTALVLRSTVALAAELPPVDVELEPLLKQIARLAEAMSTLGAPLAAADKIALRRARSARDVQRVLDPRVLLLVDINPEQRVKVQQVMNSPRLREHGWRSFLIKVTNQSGTTAPLQVESPNAAPIHREAAPALGPTQKLQAQDAIHRWMDLALHDAPPFRRELSGLQVEYRLLKIYCDARRAGTVVAATDPAATKDGEVAAGPFKREAKITFNVGQGTQDIGFRNEADVLFTCMPDTRSRSRAARPPSHRR